MSTPQTPHIVSKTDASTADTKWVALRKISWVDQSGRPREWEVAERKTRSSSSGVDAVAMGTIIKQPGREDMTILVLQYRPPVGATTVEWPAGLVDEGEGVEDAARRELREETGYEGKVLGCGPVVASDPGMTSANMVLVMMEVVLGEGEEMPEQRLDEGEFIQRVVVPVGGLYERLVELSKEEGVVVSAKLFHWAAGYHYAKMGGL